MSKIIDYKPFDERTPDSQYRDLLITIMTEGLGFVPIHQRLPENAHLNLNGSKDITGYELVYNLSNGFPLQTIRNFEKGFYGSLGEICAFLNGASTLEELGKFGTPDIFWGPSITKERNAVFGLKEGELGPGSYGPILRYMPGPDGKVFDQVLALENMIKRMPYSRTLSLTSWYPPYAVGDKTQDQPRKVNVAPCHGTFTRIKMYDQEKILHIHTTQRSADAPVGLIGNITQWCALGMMIADLFGYTFTKYVYSLPDAQIYSIQYDCVNELTAREPLRLPTVRLEPKGVREHIWDYRPEDFVLSDYTAHKGMKIPVAV